ncbi:sulfotransferase family 2 domain-containing protein [Psychromarinibacter halotolerans]|uniref:Sulfotransferase family 2 domain-containing protein n=1 Tax=Psychromarinibacter halotolerans TaxID=1775175 RepID=A0ABV7H0Y2_9RHOB|nr:sulfotransferase family 2 domain-containing protein [Psychromarinibacter halotolerans]MDF0596114.1 sulfotransferase family 2 domain-containing protein [Psychromarinibacter halotolerans]
MIISHGRRFVFVHIPKTGGTSLSLALEARAMKDDILIGDTPKAKQRRGRLKGVQTRGRLWKHSTLADIDGLVSPQELDEMFVFTLVRNPWDRMVSYYHWLQTQEFDHSAVRLAKRVPFPDFVRHPTTQMAFASSSAASYVTDATGRERCDAFVRLEHLKTDLVPVESHLGFALDVPYFNASNRARDYRTYYDTDLTEIVGSLCRHDRKRFGYTFG